MGWSTVTSRPTSLEPLEARTLLTGSAPYPFVVAGMSFDQAVNGALGAQPPSFFWGEGTIDAGDHFYSTSFERFDGQRRGGNTPMPWNGFTRPSADRMSLSTAPGYPGYTSQQGSQFIAQQGFSAGSFVGRDASGAARDVADFVEPYAIFTGLVNGQVLGLATYLRTDYIIASFIATTPSLQLEPATLIISPDNGPHATLFTFDYLLPSGRVRSTAVPVVSETATLTTFGNGVRIYLTFNHSTNFLIVDPNPGDGVVGYGMGLARFQSPDHITSDMMPGTYRATVMTTGPQSEALFGVAAAPAGLSAAGVASDVITINIDGTYAIYRADQFDQGSRLPVSSGTWRYTPNVVDPELDRGRLELNDGTGRIAVFRPTRLAAGLLLPVSIDGPALADHEKLFGLATAGKYKAFAPGLNFQEAVFDVDPFGHPVAYEHATSDDPDAVGWYSVDLVGRAGGTPVTGTLYSWHDLSFTRLAVVGRSASTGHLELWERSSNIWTYRDLTASITGAAPLGGDLAGATYGIYADPYRSPNAAIVATDTAGKFIAYVEAAGAWSFVNVEALGLLGDGVHPTLVTPLAGFGTPWRGYNFAGVDTQGQIWSLWWAPGLGGPQWAINNLSVIAGGTPRMASHLAAVVTPWNAFHITGLDVSGRVVVTWWERTVGWRYDGLTELTHGPAMYGLNLATNYNITQNVINIVGMDGLGNVVVYWWSPQLGWNVGYPATGLLAPTVPNGPILSEGFIVPYTSIPGLTDSFQSISWHSAQGDAMRVVWHTQNPAVWALEDLADLSRPL